MKKISEILKTNEMMETYLSTDPNLDSAELEKVKDYYLYKNQNTIFVGTGTCGLAAGAGAVLEEIQKWKKNNPKKEFRIVEVGCIGYCVKEPLVDIKIAGKARVCYGNVNKETIHEILDGIFNNKHFLHPDLIGYFHKDGEIPQNGMKTVEENPFFSQQLRIVLENCGKVDPDQIDSYLVRGGYSAFTKALKTMKPSEIINEILESGLRGRGGGGFLTGKKLQFASGRKTDHKYIICNADEGDPGAFMDRSVLEGDPHKVIEGMMINGLAIGADRGYIYCRAEYPLAIRRLEKALKQAREYNLLGENILNTGFNFDLKVKKGAGAFVCGEETALIHSIEGKRGMPRPRPPYPAVSGVHGYPTVINNVETLANIAPIIKNGASWFSSIGAEGSRGTKVFALTGKIRYPGLIEVPMGVTLREVVFKIGGGIPHEKEYKAVQIGGPSGGCIPLEHIDTPVTYESLKKVGAMMGSGGLVVMDENTCMVDVAKFFMNFIQSESCGKCIPCREGTRRMLEILERLTFDTPTPVKSDAELIRFLGVNELESLAEIIRETSLCGLGQTAPNPVMSTLRFFRHEYEEHLFERKCRAGVCQGLKTFKVVADKCIGCGLCKRVCPVNAIAGELKQTHRIQSTCIQCGNCQSKCPVKAIIQE